MTLQMKQSRALRSIFQRDYNEETVYTAINDYRNSVYIHFDRNGILLNLAIILWCSASTVCFFAAIVIRNSESNNWFFFLFFSGLLSAYLLFDDFFQFHEILAGDHVGISEKFTYMALGIAVLIYLFIFRRNIWRTNFWFLLMSFIFLASSVAIDVFQSWLMLRVGHWQFFIEEGTKWLGISSWCSYYMQTSFQLVVGSSFRH
jgi:hypothetical protein